MYQITKLVVSVMAGFLLATTLYAQNKTLTNGTLIITLISNDTVWLGADTRTSALTETGYTVNKEGMCKINSTNNVVYAMAGHVKYVDNSFNFLNIMRNCISRTDNFNASMELFQKQTKTEIKSILTRFSRKSINALIKTNNGAFLSVIAISFTQGERKMVEMKFSVQAKSTGSYNVIYKSSNDNEVGSLRFLGHGTNASDFIKNNSFYFGNGKNIPNKIADLIKLESTKGTVTVGLPADVISIYNNGFKRVITSGLCDAETP